MASFVFRSEAIATPNPDPVDVKKVAVEAASQLKAGVVTVSRGNDATDANRLVASTTAGNYVVTFTKGEAKVDKTVDVTFGFATDDRFVTEVTAINAKQVAVKFATPVTKTTVLNASNEVQNMAFTMVTGATVNPGQLKGSLSEDGKTLTIIANSIFNGEYAFKLTDAIKSVTGEKFEEHTAIVIANDKVATKLVSGSAAGKTSMNSFALLFDEPVNASRSYCLCQCCSSDCCLQSNQSCNHSRELSNQRKSVHQTLEVSNKTREASNQLPKVSNHSR